MIDVFVGVTEKKEISLWKDESLRYLMLVEASDVDIQFSLDWEGANVDVYCIFLWWKQNKNKGRVYCRLNASHTQVQMYTLSFLTSGSNVEIDGWIDIEKNIQKAVGHLLEENIVLGDQVKIKTLPVLNVKSNDVQASHWAKIDRLDDKKMFYMQSRWISNQEAKRLIVEWYINVIFEKFSEEETVEKMTEHKERLLDKILNCEE